MSAGTDPTEREANDLGFLQNDDIKSHHTALLKDKS